MKSYNEYLTMAKKMNFQGLPVITMSKEDLMVLIVAEGLRHKDPVLMKMRKEMKNERNPREGIGR
jgi:hypothetical protein